MSAPHTSILLEEFLELYRGREIHTYVDGTLGAGGHAHAILSEHPEIQHFIGIDQDSMALGIAAERLKPFGDKVRLVQDNFSNLETILADLGIETIDGIFLDLGVSSMQLDIAERGFSFLRDGPLDMRMNPEKGESAADLVNTLPEEELARIFWVYGEERKSRRAAHAIVEARKEKKILTTQDLVQVLSRALPNNHKVKTHPMTRVFQGLRIAVNAELERVETVLPVIIEKLAPEGRAGVITFHSLEDRIVKNVFKAAAATRIDDPTSPYGHQAIDPIVSLVNRKPLVASKEEQKANPRSRSAKMRFIEKI